MNLKRFIYYFFLALTISSIMMVLVILIKTPKVIKKVETGSSDIREILVDKNNTLIQHFFSQIDTINSIDIHLEKITNKEGYLEVSVFEGEKELDSKRVKITELEEYANNPFEFKKLKKVNKKNLYFKIKTIDSNSKIYIQESSQYTKNQYIIYNGKKRNSSVTFVYIGIKNNKSFVIHFLLLFVTSLLLTVFCKDEISIERKR